jgi:hypothetical protein
VLLLLLLLQALLLHVQHIEAGAGGNVHSSGK